MSVTLTVIMTYILLTSFVHVGKKENMKKSKLYMEKLVLCTL